MTDKRIIFRRPDGGISITTPAEPIGAGETEEQYLDRIEARLREPHTNRDGVLMKYVPDDWERIAVLPVSDIPSDRSFRDAWSWPTDGKVLEIDIEKAREITKCRLRVEREPLLAALDIEFMRATEANADTSDIIAEKERLRDITALADTAATPDELKLLSCRNS